jgi:hypothetical protein
MHAPHLTQTLRFSSNTRGAQRTEADVHRQRDVGLDAGALIWDHNFLFCLTFFHRANMAP